MSEVRRPRYAIIEVEVVGHQSFGVVVRDGSGRKGSIDRYELFDSQSAEDVWPPVGAWIRAVVLGYYRDGRVRLSSRPRDLLLTESVDDPAVSLDRWKMLDHVDGVAKREFYGLREARPLLAWALAHAPGSDEYEKALRVISSGPEIFSDLLGNG